MFNVQRHSSKFLLYCMSCIFVTNVLLYQSTQTQWILNKVWTFKYLVQKSISPKHDESNYSEQHTHFSFHSLYRTYFNFNATIIRYKISSKELLYRCVSPIEDHYKNRSSKFPASQHGRLYFDTIYFTRVRTGKQ